jgi:hypothetical protein
VTAVVAYPDGEWCMMAFPTENAALAFAEQNQMEVSIAPGGEDVARK